MISKYRLQDRKGGIFFPPWTRDSLQDFQDPRAGLWRSLAHKTLTHFREELDLSPTLTDYHGYNVPTPDYHDYNVPIPSTLSFFNVFISTSH